MRGCRRTSFTAHGGSGLLRIGRGETGKGFSRRRATGGAAALAFAAWLLCGAPAYASVEPIVDPAFASISQFDLAPDGRRITWLAASGGTNSIFVRDLHGGTVTVLPTTDGLGAPRWAGDSRHIFVPTDPTGDENTHILAYDVDLPAQRPIDITPYPGKKAVLVDVSNPDGSALVALNLAKPSIFDLYRVKHTGGPAELVESGSAGNLSWMVSTKGNVFGRILHDAGGKWRVETTLPSDRQRAFTVSDPIGPGNGIASLGDARPDGTAWFLTRGALDTATAQRLSLADGSVQETVPNAAVDADFVLIGPDLKPLIVQTMPDYPVLQVFDPELRKLLQATPLPIHSVLKEVSWDRSMMHLLLLFRSDRDEENVVFVDRMEGTAQLLFHQAVPFLVAHPPRTIPVTIRARDSLVLHGYLTVPPGQAARNLPLVLMVHGGPWVRDIWGPDPNVTFLALAGYAVLRVNYRGSGGYGRAFEQAGIGEWGRKMQSDLTDAACWAAKQGIADPRRMAIMGGSYGGYAAIEALVQTPRLFAAAISMDGPVDLPAMLKEMRPYAKPYLSLFWDFIAADRDTQWDRSPLAHIDKIERPLLAFQGVNDPRVSISQLEKLERAMLAANKPLIASYLLDEGHGIEHQRNFVPYMKKILEFLKNNLRDSPPAEATLDYCQ
jgi:dienelactone hydrolase